MKRIGARASTHLGASDDVARSVQWSQAPFGCAREVTHDACLLAEAHLNGTRTGGDG